MSNDGGRVRIDEDRIRQARDLQQARNTVSDDDKRGKLNTLPPQISTYALNGKLEIQPGRTLRHGDDDGESL